MITSLFTRCGDFQSCNCKIWLLTTEIDSIKTKTMHITLSCLRFCFVVVTKNLPFVDEEWPLKTNFPNDIAIKPDSKVKRLYFISFLYFHMDSYSECLQSIRNPRLLSF